MLAQDGRPDPHPLADHLLTRSPIVDLDLQGSDQRYVGELSGGGLHSLQLAVGQYPKEVRARKARIDRQPGCKAACAHRHESGG